jgi:hypothetical protein
MGLQQDCVSMEISFLRVGLVHPYPYGLVGIELTVSEQIAALRPG